VFQGALQEVRVVAGPHGYLSQCPHLDSSCPTCGQYLHVEANVERMVKRMHQLEQRVSTQQCPAVHKLMLCVINQVEEAEKRLAKLEGCDCQKSCRVNGSVHADGATWQRNCELCACVVSITFR
jgi:hypothetical protein